MEKKRHSAAEIAAKLEQAEALAAQGQTQSEISQALGISVMTLHRWRKRLPQRAGAIKGSAKGRAAAAAAEVPESAALARISELQVENARLRKLVTDLLLEKMTLEDEGQWSPRLPA